MVLSGDSPKDNPFCRMIRRRSVSARIAMNFVLKPNRTPRSPLPMQLYRLIGQLSNSSAVAKRLGNLVRKTFIYVPLLPETLCNRVRSMKSIKHQAGAIQIGFQSRQMAWSRNLQKTENQMLQSTRETHQRLAEATLASRFQVATLVQLFSKFNEKASIYLPHRTRLN